MKPGPHTLPPHRGHAAQASACALSAEALDRAGRLFRFNWLLANDIHADWLGPLAEVLTSHGPWDERVLRHVSMSLVTRYQLRDRYVRSSDLEEHPWLIGTAASLMPLAQTLGVAMLGGWVRTSLERESVSQQNRVLTPAQRQQAMHHACTMRWLPHGHWPLSSHTPEAVSHLGLSCLVAVPSVSSGAGDRLKMQFPRSALSPLSLSTHQREEAQALIRSMPSPWTDIASHPRDVAPTAWPSRAAA